MADRTCRAGNANRAACGGLLAMALVALVPIGSRADDPAGRWLWAHVDTEMGLGDQLHFHEAVLLLARGTGRTAVLPTLQITVTDFGPIADVDPTADEGRSFDAAITRALGGAIRSSANLPRSTRRIPFDRWFDVRALEAATATPVSTADAWHGVSHGRIDHVLVPAAAHGCLPIWEAECEDAIDGRLPARSVRRLGRPITFADIECVSSVPDWTSIAAGRLLAQRLKASDATTVGLDGLCLRMPFPPRIEDARREVRTAFRLAPSIRARAARFRERHGLRRYLALHWRRGDVLVDHPDTFAWQTPERVVDALERVARRRGLGDLDGIVLLTDAFSRPELERLSRLLPQRLGLPVLRFDADAALRRTFDPDRQIDHLIMDLALGAEADVLVGSYIGSNFLALMQTLAGKGPPPIPLFVANDPNAIAAGMPDR